MSPEKVAILVVAGLIAVLLAVALVGTESNGNASPPAGTQAKVASEKPKPAPKQIEEYTYNDIVQGSAKSRPAAKPVAETQPAGAAQTTEYVVKKNDTIEKIASRELGNKDLKGRILALNKGLNPSKLKIGSKILLPVVRQDPHALTADASKPKTGAAARRKPETLVVAKAAKAF